MPGTLTYRKSGTLAVYSAYIEIELPQPLKPKVHVTRYREESYVISGGCGSCGYQTPIVEYRTVPQTQDVKETEVRVGRFVYQFADIQPDDVIKIELYEGKKAKQFRESISYTATKSGFTITSSTGRRSSEEGLEIILVDGEQPVRASQHSTNLREQPQGLVSVRNGFTMQGLFAIPIPHINTAEQSLLRALEKKQIPEPAGLN